MQNDPVIESIVNELMASHAAHTILLYGSRADGSANNESDYDVAAFAAIATPQRIARWSAGAYLDLFIYPEWMLLKPTEEQLKLIGSYVLLQRGAEAQEYLASLEDIFNQGLQRLPADEIAARKTWAHKMVTRMQRNDAEGNYRRVWLLTALLEDYFHLRGMWYLGPKKSLRWLEQYDVATSNAMQRALQPAASVAAIATVVQLVAGELDT